MPAQYDAIKKSEMKSGKSKKEAERIAAATYNKNRPKGAKPVTRNFDKKKRKKAPYDDRGAMETRAAAGLKKAFPGSAC